MKASLIESNWQGKIVQRMKTEEMQQVVHGWGYAKNDSFREGKRINLQLLATLRARGKYRAECLVPVLKTLGNCVLWL